MDEKLDTLEARILRLKRELYECKQEAAGVLQQRNQLYKQFEDNSRKYAARLKADIEKDQQMVNSKKMKLATAHTSETRARFTWVRDSPRYRRTSGLLVGQTSL